MADEKKEKIIAACVKNEFGYWGVGENHGWAAKNLIRNKELVYPGKAPDNQCKFNRRMMTDTGRSVSLREAWEICYANKTVGKSFEHMFDVYKKSAAFELGKSENEVTPDEVADTFTSGMFPGYTDEPLTKAFATAHNLMVKKRVTQSMDKTDMQLPDFR